MWQQLDAAKKHPEGSFKVVNTLAMAQVTIPIPRSPSASGCP
jgi:hypothetical protein